MYSFNWTDEKCYRASAKESDCVRRRMWKRTRTDAGGSTTRNNSGQVSVAGTRPRTKKTLKTTKKNAENKNALLQVLSHSFDTPLSCSESESTLQG
jgi:hypothetical protein